MPGLILADALEISAGLVLAAGLAVIGPVAVIGGVFVAWGKLRSRVDQNREDLREIRAKAEALREAQVLEARATREAQAALLERLRVELDGHARVLAGRIEAAGAAERRDRQALAERIGSVERWRERMRGASEARAGIPQQIRGADTTPIEMPLLPRSHTPSSPRSTGEE